MTILNVTIIIILIIIVFFIIFYFNSQSNIIYDKLLNTNLTTNSNKEHTISYKDNKSSLYNSSNNFSLSVWFNIQEWDNNSKYKSILYISDTDNITRNGDSDTDPDLWIFMDKHHNDLFINLRQPQQQSGQQSRQQSTSKIVKYEVKNINLQKWNCLTISIDSNVLDVYINGKLRNSFVIDTMFERKYTTPDIYLGYYSNDNNHESISGYISRIRYYNTSISNKDAYNIYIEGINQSLLNKLSNNYSLKVALMENDIQKAGLTI